MILHIFINPNGTYGKCVLSPCISNMVRTCQQFAVAKKVIPDPVLERVKFSKTVPRNCYFIKQTSQKIISDNLYEISMLTLPVFFYTFVTTTLKFRMCFIVIKLHYNKCKCVCGGDQNLNVAHELEVVVRCTARCRKSTQYSSSLLHGVNLGWLLLLLWLFF